MSDIDHVSSKNAALERADRAEAPGDNESELGERLTYLYEHALRATPEQIAMLLRSGRSPPDRAFDRFLPLRLRALSAQYWTPLMVVTRVAGWLRDFEVQSVVDVGSGAGKFCVAASLASGCKFVGIEQRAKLVSAARNLAELFGIQDRVDFLQGAVGETEVPRAQAYYLFNPFGENIYGSNDCIDEEVELSHDRYERDVSLMEGFLRDAPPGTFLITYNGFGGRTPDGYEVVGIDLSLPNVLRMWRKTRR